MLFALLVGLNLLVWAKARINYTFIFVSRYFMVLAIVSSDLFGQGIKNLSDDSKMLIFKTLQNWTYGRVWITASISRREASEAQLDLHSCSC